MGKKKHPEHVNHERWLVSYADLLTLLFAFFVVLFASSVSDKKKTQQMAAAMQTAFQQHGAFEAHSTTPALTPGAGAAQGKPQPLIAPIDSAAEAARETRRIVEHSLGTSVLRGDVKVRESASELTLSLQDAGFFDSGSAEIRSSALPLLTRIAQSLPRKPLRVEGHTDNVPMHSASFRSNWELSTARASAIAQLLLQKSTVSPADFSIAGYGEFHPIAANTTAEGRAQNRRVDIVILH